MHVIQADHIISVIGSLVQNLELQDNDGWLIIGGLDKTRKFFDV